MVITVLDHNLFQLASCIFIWKQYENVQGSCFNIKNVIPCLQEIKTGKAEQRLWRFTKSSIRSKSRDVMTKPGHNQLTAFVNPRPAGPLDFPPPAGGGDV